MQKPRWDGERSRAGRPALARLARHVYYYRICLYAKGVPMEWLSLSKFTVQTFTQFLQSLIVGLYRVSVNACTGDFAVSNGEPAVANRTHDQLIEVA